MKEDIADLKGNTHRIVESFTQVVWLENKCTCKEKLSDLKKDLQALETKLSIKEEDFRRRVLTKNARVARCHELFKRLEEIERTIISSQSQSLCSRGVELVSESSAPIVTSGQQRTDISIKHQWETRCNRAPKIWCDLGDKEGAKALTDGCPSYGHHTVLLLDISESMASGDSWTEAKHFVNTFLSGLEEHSKFCETLDPINEHVALVTFGHQTKTKVPMTKDFRAVRDTIDKLELGGPSPLTGALHVAYRIAVASNKPELINGVLLHNRVIVITDGLPTELTLLSGPDVSDLSQVNEEQHFILRFLDKIQDEFISTYFIEVPNVNFLTTFFYSIRDPDIRNVFECYDGRRLAKRNYLCVRDIGSLMSDGDCSAEDHKDMQDMQDLAAATRRLANRLFSKERPEDVYRESNCKTLPIIGSRVRRGPDWKNDNQDDGGPGTVVGHCKDDLGVWVQWDNAYDDCHLHRYGEFFDVLVVNEMRHLKPRQRMAVGCHVKPGPDGIFHNIHDWNKGVVIKMTPPKAQVRWDSGMRGDYSYGEDGKSEITLCESHVEYSSIDSGISSDTASARPRCKAKYKSAK